ncbi:MAG: hypothetical protein AAFU03_15655, partial [Bacteroidota bacterium]
FSVDDLQFDVLQSQVKKAQMDGNIQVPLLKKAAENVEANNTTEQLEKADCLIYRAEIEPGRSFYFRAETQANYRVPMWQSGLTINDGTMVELHYAGGELEAIGTLNGEIDIDAGVGENFRLEARDIIFNGVVLSSRTGIVNYGKWDPPGTISADLGPFGVTISDIDFLPNESTGDPTLKFAALVDVGIGEMDITAGGAFRLIGDYSVEGELQKFRYKDFKMDALHVDASTSSFAVKATIAFYRDDPTYGDGFYGHAELWLKAFEKMNAGMAAVAQFGAVGGSRYFMIDALFQASPGVPMGPFNLMAARGGVWNNMVPASAPSQDFSGGGDASGTIGAVAAAVNEGSPTAIASFVGMTISGQKYVPASGGFGIRLGVVLGLIPNPEVFSLNALLEININENNGWNASIRGNGTFFSPVNYTNEPPSEGLAAFFDISYVRSGGVGSFSASADLFVKYGGLT